MAGPRRVTAVMLAAALGGVFGAIATRVEPASASSGQISILQDDPHLAADPAAVLARLRLLGAETIRVSVAWNSIAPRPNARHRPHGFDASDPGAYPPANWRVWDAIVSRAEEMGVTVDFDLMGGAPRWALGPGRPSGNSNPNWEPSAAEFGGFVRAVATRYSGSYNPTHARLAPGDPGDLPRVSFWSIWNEPDYGPSLAPQGIPGERTVENSPQMYRNLLGTAWRALQASGHHASTDTILFGELAPRGQARWGIFSGMAPLVFLRALYCVDAGYRPLRGTAARIRGCPVDAAAARRFRAQNPALFEASGVSDHPYMRWYAPNHELSPDPTNRLSTRDYTSLGVIGNLTRALDRLVRVYGARTHLPVYGTEFGYITSPPKRSPDPHSRTRVLYLPPAIAARYMNWGEYLSWRNPRLRSFSQYPLFDPVRPTSANDWGGFASGVLSWNGIQKATYDAWRLPVYLPRGSARLGRALEVWGCVRPARYAILDTGEPQVAEIQFAPGASGAYSTVQTVQISDPANCYFDVRLHPPSSGRVRLAYTYPAGAGPLGAGAAIFSRSVRVAVR